MRTQAMWANKVDGWWWEIEQTGDVWRWLVKNPEGRVVASGNEPTRWEAARRVKAELRDCGTNPEYDPELRG